MRTDVVIPDDDDDLDVPGQPPGDTAPHAVDDEPMVFNAAWKAASSGDLISAPPPPPTFPQRTFTTEGSLVQPVVSTDGVATPPTIPPEQDAATKMLETPVEDPVTPLAPRPPPSAPGPSGEESKIEERMFPPDENGYIMGKPSLAPDPKTRPNWPNPKKAQNECPGFHHWLGTACRNS